MNVHAYIAYIARTIIWRLLQVLALFVRGVRREKASLVLVPCEPWSVIGSRGDEAMVYAVLNDFRSRHPNGKITVVINRNYSFCLSEDCRRLKKDFGEIDFTMAWAGTTALIRVFLTIIKTRATEVVALGADCMDGYYQAGVSEMLMSSVDIALRMGVSARLTGFSFNDTPHHFVVKSYSRLTKKMVLNIRDSVSFAHFEKHVSTRAGRRLVADVAFCLKPKYSLEIPTEKGFSTLAFNLHSMLSYSGGHEEFVCKVADGLRRFLMRNPAVRLVLVPHDYRPQGDLGTLKRIRELIGMDSRIYLIDEILSAAELKGLMRSVDALFTSRMHLGIAALGMGKPIGAFMYQGKFLGLFDHFDLPRELVLDPEEVGRLPEVLENLLGKMSLLSNRVVNAYSRVKSLSMLNLKD